jgi:hypothetical protein
MAAEPSRYTLDVSIVEGGPADDVLSDLPSSTSEMPASHSPFRRFVFYFPPAYYCPWKLLCKKPILAKHTSGRKPTF